MENEVLTSNFSNHEMIFVCINRSTAHLKPSNYTNRHVLAKNWLISFYHNDLILSDTLCILKDYHHLS